MVFWIVHRLVARRRAAAAPRRAAAVREPPPQKTRGPDGAARQSAEPAVRKRSARSAPCPTFEAEESQTDAAGALASFDDERDTLTKHYVGRHDAVVEAGDPPQRLASDLRAAIRRARGEADARLARLGRQARH